MMGPPIKAPPGTDSLNSKTPKRDAIIGSPRGMDVIAVGVIYFNP